MLINWNSCPNFDEDCCPSWEPAWGYYPHHSKCREANVRSQVIDACREESSVYGSSGIRTFKVTYECPNCYERYTQTLGEGEIVWEVLKHYARP